MAYQGGYVGHEYPVHVPPSMQHRPKPTRRRKAKPPASLSKLERPLTRFYCNDCKKKFRSRILANRNNNAVQHYCSLYQKIITRKVDSHSNKCQADHGMGPCVVKRTDLDPDSDGEDETKAAYYADKGKRPRATPRSTPSKRKLRDRDVPTSATPTLKRQRIDHNNTMPPPPAPEYTHNIDTFHTAPPGAEYHGFYGNHGYLREAPPQNGNAYPPPPPYQEYTHNVPPPPPAEDYHDAPPMEMMNESSMPPPPPINGTERTENGDSMTPSAIPMPLSTDDNHNHMMSTQNDAIPPRIEDGLRVNMNDAQNELDAIPPPPPPLEEFQPLPIDDETNDTKPDESQMQEITINHQIESTVITTANGHSDSNGHDKLSLLEVKDNTTEPMITLDGGKVNGHNGHNGHRQEEKKEEVINGKPSQSADDDDCINVSDEDEISELKEPASSTTPKKGASKTNMNGQEDEDEDDDLILTAPE